MSVAWKIDMKTELQPQHFSSESFGFDRGYPVMAQQALFTYR